MNKFNGYDELSDRKQMQHWAGSKKFHDDNDKKIAELEKEKEEKEKRKAKDFKITAPCYMKPSSSKATKKKVNENSVVKLNESQLRKIVAESVKNVLKEWRPQNPEDAALDYGVMKSGNGLADRGFANNYYNTQIKSQKSLQEIGDDETEDEIQRMHDDKDYEFQKCYEDLDSYVENMTKDYDSETIIAVLEKLLDFYRNI